MDNELFWKLLKPVHEPAAAFCRRLAGTDEDGDDLYQQSILKAMRRLGSLRDHDRFRSWLYRIVINTHKNRCRSWWRRHRVPLTREVVESSSAVGSVISFDALRARHRAAQVKLTTMERIMLTIENRFRTRPVFWLACGLGMLALSFVALVPISYTQTVGYAVTVPRLGESLGASPELLNAAMTASGLEDVQVSSTVENGVESYVFATLGSESEANDLAGALAGLTGTDDEPSIEPIRRRTSGTLLAQATERHVVEKKPRTRIKLDDKKIIINGERLDGAVFSPDSSDLSVEALLERIFSKLGSESTTLHVDVKTIEDSTYRVITIELDPTGRTVSAGKPVKICMDDREIGATWEAEDVVDRLGKMIEMEFPGRDDTLMSGRVILKVKLRE